MTRKFLTILLLFSFLLPGLLLAQSHILKANGTLKKVDSEALRIPAEQLYKYQINQKKSSNLDHITASADTLKYTDFGTWNTNFGQFGQDVMLQWFVAPADMDILAVRVEVTDDEWDEIEIKLVSANWTEEQFNDVAGVTARLGYYEATGNGYLDSNPYLEDETTTGDWIWAIEGADEADSTNWVDVWGEPFGADLWSDFGAGADVTLVDGEYTAWLDLSLLFVPQVKQGDVFAVSLKNTSTLIDIDPDPPVRTGFMSSADRGIGAFKYYANGRNTVEGDWGWWHRTYTWNIEVAVSLTGDRAPVIQEITQLSTTTSEDARTVDMVATDDNPAGGAAGIASANLYYSVDAGDYIELAMSGSEPNYTIDIPGQAAGSSITYYVEVTDVEGLSSRTPDIAYDIFKKSEDVLFLYNSTNYSQGTASFYYMGAGAGHLVTHDFWSTPSSGTSILDEVLALYDNVIQVDGTHPEFDVSEIVKAWLMTGTAGEPKRYFWSSQDQGDWWDNWPEDTTFAPGTFYYDYMGVAQVTDQDWPAVSMRGDPWLVSPVADDPVSGWAAAYNADSSVSHYYDPAFETGMTNYMDNLVLVDGGNAVATFTSIDSAGADKIVGVRNNADGFYTAWIVFDYLSTNFRANLDSSHGADPGYAWGVNVASQAAEFLEWGGFSAIETGGEISPRAYRLSQNYPNPFNPTTTIDFSIPNKTKVTLKVFDLQGREVVTLIDGKIKAGSHSVTFDASNYATGVYFYQLLTDNQAMVKKMVLIK
jgi:hypothetical protein